MFYTLIKHWFFDQSERAQGPIYVIKLDPRKILAFWELGNVAEVSVWNQCLSIILLNRGLKAFDFLKSVGLLLPNVFPWGVRKTIRLVISGSIRYINVDLCAWMILIAINGNIFHKVSSSYLARKLLIVTFHFLCGNGEEGDVDRWAL